MSMSLTGMVFWGYDLGDLSGDSDGTSDLRPEWMRTDQDWEDVVAAELGYEEMLRPTGPRAGDPGWDAFRNSEDYLLYQQHLASKWSLVRSVGAKLDTYGGEDAQWAIVARESVTESYYNCVKIPSLDVDPAWGERCGLLAELLGIRLFGDPGWHVTASYL